VQEVNIYDNQISDIVEAQEGSKMALEKLILNNKGLIWSIVKRFKDRGYEIEDLYQIAVMGFIKSIKKFDTSFDVKLSTYAVPYILGEVKRYIQTDGPIKVSRSIKELLYKISEIQKEYLKKGREVTIEEISKEVKLPKEEIVIALESKRPVNSIYESEDENDMELIEKICDGTDEQNKVVNKIVIIELLKTLTEKERQIILLRYFRGKTQSEVAKIVGVNQVQISRIEKKVLENMRKKLTDNTENTA
jgi:RNA polymerase sporulation-specific sigma factor